MTTPTRSAKLTSAIDALDEIILYLDTRADVDDGIPNAAMKLRGVAKDALEDLKSVFDSMGDK